MEIKVLNNYGGHNTNERRILSGEYNSEDPALFGLAQYLVDNGHASVVVEDDISQDVKVGRAMVEVGRTSSNIILANAEDVEEYGLDYMIEKSNKENERDYLIDEYETLTGRKPSKNIKTDTLRERVAEIKASE